MRLPVLEQPEKTHRLGWRFPGLQARRRYSNVFGIAPDYAMSELVENPSAGGNFRRGDFNYRINLSLRSQNQLAVKRTA